LFSASIFLDWAILIFFSRSSSNIIVILFAINFYHRFWLFETFLVLDFVLKIAPQQGHRKLSIAKNILHIEHLFLSNLISWTVWNPFTFKVFTNAFTTIPH
jgi:hypothetical protein